MPGDVIEPGNWGKKILEYGLNHSLWYREVILEAVRLHNFPSKPSRFNCTFSCDSLEAIKAYKSRHCHNGYIYKVDIMNKEYPIHKADFNAVEPLPGVKENMMQMAQMYWQYIFKTSVEDWPGVECSEILTLSSLKIIKQITE